MNARVYNICLHHLSAGLAGSSPVASLPSPRAPVAKFVAVFGLFCSPQLKFAGLLCLRPVNINAAQNSVEEGDYLFPPLKL